MGARKKRYLVEHEGKPVAEIGSLAGLRTALAAIEHAETSVLSLAYPQESGWLEAWADSGGPRVLIVKDMVGAESYVVDVVELRDTSGDGQVFEALVSHARRQV